LHARQLTGAPRAWHAGGPVRLFVIQPRAAQSGIPGRAASPLLPGHGAKPAPDPRVQFPQHARRLAEPEVADPTAKVDRHVAHHPPRIHAAGSPRQLPDALLTPPQRLGRDAPCRSPAAGEAEPEELPSARPIHRACLAVDLQLEFARDEVADARHHALPAPFAVDVDVAIIRVPHDRRIYARRP